MNAPRIARWLLEIILPAADASDFLDDMDELYRHRRRTRGRLRADLWYWKHSLTSGPRLLFATRHDAPGAGRVLSDFVFDLRFAARSLRRSPGFVVAVLATLGLGLGANMVVFGVVHTAIFRPLPFPDANALVWLWPDGDLSLTQERFDELAPAVASAGELSAFAHRSYSVRGQDQSTIVGGTSVSTNHFDVLGLPPVLGRAFIEADGHPGAEPVAVISDELWRTHFGADSSVIGRSMDLFTAASIPMTPGAFTGTPHTIVGVLPPLYRPLGLRTDVLTPLVRDPEDPNYANMGELVILGRLGPGTTPSALRSALARVPNEHPTLAPLAEGLERGRVVPLRDAIYGSRRPPMLLTLAAVALVLLIACANVANLALARFLERRHELGIRHAIGAARGRLTRQLLAESVLLAALATFAGGAVAYVSLPVAMALTPHDVTLDPAVGFGAAVVVFALVAFGLTTLVTGVLPALAASRGVGGPAGRRRRMGGGTGGRRLTRALVTAEFAVALVLAHGAGLLVKSFDGLTRVDPGFDPEHVTTMRIAPSEQKYESAEERRTLFAQIMEEVRALPGVASAGAIHFLPIADGGPGIYFRMDPSDPDSRRSSGYRVITPDYVETMRVPVLEGRTFDASDVPGGVLVGLVNQRLAELLWPGESAVGRTVYRTNGDPFFTVVGVVGNVRQAGVGSAPQPEIYLPLSQTEWSAAMSIVVRTTGPLPGLSQQLREIVLATDPNLPITRTSTMERVMEESVTGPRFFGALFSLFAVLALLLGGIGVYGVVSSVVADRTDEIGIRLALGATRSEVLRWELARGGRTVLAGLLLGIVLTVAGSRFLTSMLHGISPTDPAVAALAAGLLGLVALAATFVPAVRASRIDPMRAIRSAD